MMRHRLRRGERGQVLIFFMVMITVTLVSAIIVIDFGAWHADRRTAQKDADAAVLAGAHPLLASRHDPSITTTQLETMAVDRVVEWALRNGVDESALVINPRIVQQCWDQPAWDGKPDGVETEIDADSVLMLSRIFTALGIKVGAHAKACVGSLVTTTGLRPWAIPILTSECFETDPATGVRLPEFGEQCAIRTDQPQQVGSINLEDDEAEVLADPDAPCNSGNSGAQPYKDNIEEGSPANCAIGDIIGTKQGLATGPTKDGLQTLLELETTLNAAGDGCDSRYNDVPPGGTDLGNGASIAGVGTVWIDDFWEAFSPPDVVPGPDVVYTARECDDEPSDLLGEPDSPRFVTVALVDELPPCCGTEDLPIEGFAGFFIERCQKLDNAGNPVPTDPDPVKNNILEAKCQVQGSQFQIVGRFVQFQQLSGRAGALTPYGTSVIVLVE